jgi:hypothetical protein
MLTHPMTTFTCVRTPYKTVSYIGLPSYSTLPGGLLHALLLLLLHLLHVLRHSRGVPPHAVVLQVQETFGWVAVDYFENEAAGVAGK